MLGEDTDMQQACRKIRCDFYSHSLYAYRTQEWGRENELQRGAGQSSMGKFHIWFHGIVSRREAESLLNDCPSGTFLVRVSESRYGYSLSFQAGARCKHYIIDQVRRRLTGPGCPKADGLHCHFVRPLASPSTPNHETQYISSQSLITCRRHVRRLRTASSLTNNCENPQSWAPTHNNFVPSHNDRP